ncbi:hypothetical protein, partial [Pseudoalteromonas ruthenica]|uniref:hypothetical protein n=1 Tax=Pseudoalteromonas ruthenica TaxID=151081 RepID=UPI001BB27038
EYAYSTPKIIFTKKPPKTTKTKDSKQVIYKFILVRKTTLQYQLSFSTLLEAFDIITTTNAAGSCQSISAI